MANTSHVTDDDQVMIRSHQWWNNVFLFDD